MAKSLPPLMSRCVAEVLGTFMLVFFGCGAVHAIVAHGALSGLWQIAIVWGVGIMAAIYVVGGISGAHLNPAVTIALAFRGRFARNEILPYAGSQLVGAFLAAAVLFTFNDPFLREVERRKDVVRGQRGSEITAMCYGEYFPDPGPLMTLNQYDPAHHERRDQLISEPMACLAEVLGTAVLALVIFAVTDPRNAAAPAARLGPVFIGLTVSILIVVIAPLTQACFNPARDFGPRLFACLAGWGKIAIPGRGTGFLTVYIVAPIVGAMLGGLLYDFVLRPALPPENVKATEA